VDVLEGGERDMNEAPLFAGGTFFVEEGRAYTETTGCRKHIHFDDVKARPFGPGEQEADSIWPR